LTDASQVIISVYGTRIMNMPDFASAACI